MKENGADEGVERPRDIALILLKSGLNILPFGGSLASLLEFIPTAHQKNVEKAIGLFCQRLTDPDRSCPNNGHFAAPRQCWEMLSDGERAVLDIALEKYQPGRLEPILVGYKKVLKPALQLMTSIA